MNIHVHIERLVLDGLSVAPHQRPLVRAAVEAELGRLLADNGLSASLLSDGAMPHVPASPIQLTDKGEPTELGQQIAQSVYGGLSR